jgi:polysaccharide biosynthesis/export protein
MFDFPDLVSAIRVHVTPDGTVHLPYAGTLRVAGMSASDAEITIADALRTKGFVKQPNVTVDIVSSASLNVSVLGQVQTPKSLPLNSPAPLSYVLAQVGGITGLAAHHISILHQGDVAPTSVDYDPDSPTPASMNLLIQPGDILNVSSRGVYFVAGEVNRPGIFPLGGAISVGQVSPQSGENVVKNITLLEALAQAGGITPIAQRSKMRLLRTVDGKRQEIIVDEVKLYKGEIADPILHADDILYVPSSYIRQQTNNLFGTALSALYAVVSLKQLQ